MANKHLQRKSHILSSQNVGTSLDAWWNEESTGVRAIIRDPDTERHFHCLIPWEGLRKALARKDK